MTEFAGQDRLEAQIDALENALGGASEMTAAFDIELRRMQATMADTGRDVGNLQRGIGRGLRKAFEGLVFDGDKLSDAMRGVGKSMVDAAYAAALKPMAGHFAGILAGGVETAVTALQPFAKGGGFAQGRVMPFARGGVVSGPTSFAMRGGAGLMGEAGPEAIMPLSRGADGRLGVQSTGGGQSVNVVMNISTPDVQGFQRSKTQIAAQVSRLIGRGQRNR